MVFMNPCISNPRVDRRTLVKTPILIWILIMMYWWFVDGYIMYFKKLLFMFDIPSKVWNVKSYYIVHRNLLLSWLLLLRHCLDFSALCVFNHSVGRTKLLLVLVWNMFYLYPLPGGDDPLWRAYLFKWLGSTQRPTIRAGQEVHPCGNLCWKYWRRDIYRWWSTIRSTSWFGLSVCVTVDGWNPANSPFEGKVVFPIIYRVSAPSQVVVWDFSHQQ